MNLILSGKGLFLEGSRPGIHIYIYLYWGMPKAWFISVGEESMHFPWRESFFDVLIFIVHLGRAPKNKRHVFGEVISGTFRSIG